MTPHQDPAIPALPQSVGAVCADQGWEDTYTATQMNTRWLDGYAAGRAAGVQGEAVQLPNRSREKRFLPSADGRRIDDDDFTYDATLTITGVFTCTYSGEWPKGLWMLEAHGDLWPSSIAPLLFKPMPKETHQ